MVNFPDLSNLNNKSGIEGLMSLPNSSYPYFWAWIIAGIWIIIVSTLYFKEKEKTGRGKLLGALAVASFAIIILSTIGSAIGIITSDIFVYILVLGALPIALWWFNVN